MKIVAVTLDTILNILPLEIIWGVKNNRTIVRLDWI